MAGTELKPCPFCGGEPDEYEGEYGNGIYCMECGAMVGEPIHLDFNVAERVSYEQAAKAWNTRAAMEFDGWFYLPKPKEPIVEVTETTNTWDGTKVRTDVFYQVKKKAIVNWAKELDENIIKRICEVWDTRAERTCCMTDRGECSECGAYIVRAWTEVHDFNGDMKRIDLRSHNYCPNCGAKVVSE